ncbi:MAG: hypothetical protein ACO3IN_13035 [Steroidobacteraceae bacterium]
MAELELAGRIIDHAVGAVPTALGAALLWGVRRLGEAIGRVFTRLDELEDGHSEMRSIMTDRHDAMTERLGMIERHLARECVPCTSSTHRHGEPPDPVEEQKDVLQHSLVRKRWRDRHGD